MRRIYLDNNVFVEIEKGNLDFSSILSWVGDENLEIPFSASHIQEAQNKSSNSLEERDSFLRSRFQTISEITSNRYIYHDLEKNGMYFLSQVPQNVYNTINEVPAEELMRSWSNLVTIDQRKQITKDLGVDKVVNNLSSKDLLEHLDNKVSVWGNFTFEGFIDYSMNLFPSEGYGLHNRIAAVFELLDMLGYWKDKLTMNSNYARLWDSSHTNFAAYCHIFISDDLRTRKKVKFVYDLYKIGTKIYNSKGIIES
ncbi:MAG: hypothetical protein WDZ35_06785 [Crocinitomicaceae bacterium]